MVQSDCKIGLDDLHDFLKCPEVFFAIVGMMTQVAEFKFCRYIAGAVVIVIRERGHVF